LIAELGFSTAKIAFEQPRRRRGITKNNFYTLYDVAMLGITNHSKVPLRLATMTGFLLGGVSLLVALGYFIAKLIWWDSFVLGTAPLIISVFFFSAVQLLFIGIVGEYVGAIYTQVQGRPLVIERERVNFEPAQSLVDDARDREPRTPQAPAPGASLGGRHSEEDGERALA
jgi:hypothetical protein